MGWDPVKQTINAPEDWWAEKLQVVPLAKKIKFIGIYSVLEEKLDGMFTTVVATGTHAFTPNNQRFGSSAQDIETVHIGESGEDPSQVHTDVQSTSVPKRPRVEKRIKESLSSKVPLTQCFKHAKQCLFHRRTTPLRNVSKSSINMLMLRRTQTNTVWRLLAIFVHLFVTCQLAAIQFGLCWL